VPRGYLFELVRNVPNFEGWVALGTLWDGGQRGLPHNDGRTVTPREMSKSLTSEPCYNFPPPKLLSIARGVLFEAFQ